MENETTYQSFANLIMESLWLLLLFDSLEIIKDIVMQIIHQQINTAGNYMFKVNNRNTRTRCEICSKLTIKTPERR